MPHITLELLRKRAEHNEMMVSSLEEISLHQEELEGINDVIRVNCKRIKILYLQNNIIPKMENLRGMKELEYLNLALNNISKIEGLENCEFLNKLDLTLNFIDLDVLEASINHLAPLTNLRDVYFMGNPSQVNWEGFNSYVIAKLPQIEQLDGKEVTKSMRILACQQLQALEKELEERALAVSLEKKAKVNEVPRVEEIKDPNPNGGESDVESSSGDDGDDNDRDKMTENTPEVRREIYLEQAAQKKEKQDREDANKPKKRDYTKEQEEAKSKIREAEEESGEVEVRQKNEGGWSFSWNEDTPGVIALDIVLPRHLDSSLIDVDVHPTYVSVVIKSKLLRLKLPEEVKVSESKCQRSKLTGHLVITMPMTKQGKHKVESIFIKQKTAAGTKNTVGRGNINSSSNNKPNIGLVERKTKKKSMAEMMLEAAAATSQPIDNADGGSDQTTTTATTTNKDEFQLSDNSIEGID